VPTGEFEFSTNEIKMARHTAILYAASTEDMIKLEELRSQSYLCKRLSRFFRCHKPLKELPSHVSVNVEPGFYIINFSESYTLDDLVTDALVSQHLVKQEVTYDGVPSESSSYKLYKHIEGDTYLDPQLSELVRFRVVDGYSLTHLKVVHKTISRKESYTIYFQNLYSKN
jgi:hypothetical protein